MTVYPPGASAGKRELDIAADPGLSVPDVTRGLISPATLLP
jgi:hypothetical protein